MDTFAGENMETQDSVLKYKIDLYFMNINWQLAEVDEKGHKDKNSEHETKRQKEIEN